MIFHRTRSLVTTAGLAVAVLAATALASAQPGGGPGGGGMSDEQRSAVWTLQAQGVAKDLALDEANTQKLVDAYKKSRESYREATRQLMQGGDRGPEALAQAREATAAERTKLKTALAEFLSAEQAEKATATLGTYGRQWDRYVAPIPDMKLDADKQQQALVAIAASVVESNAIMEKAAESGDWDSVRGSFQSQREKLEGELGKILTPEQLEQWKGATQMRGGRGGSGGGPGGPGAAPGASGARINIEERQRERAGDGQTEAAPAPAGGGATSEQKPAQN